MPIRITEINAKNIGPIREFAMRPGDLNLVYGRNEQGKTGLVEFILKCLFKTGPRSPGEWELRGLGGTGKIILGGLPEGGRAFTAGKDKLDDIWAESGRELPDSISRLLVVRGGDLALADRHPGGASREILSKLLSNEDVLASIQDAIPKNIANAEITPEGITGPARGEVQTYRERRERVAHIGALFGQAMESRSAGNTTKLRIRERELSDLINAQERAKRHRAFVLRRRIESLDDRISHLPDDEIGRLRHDIDSLGEKSAVLARKTADLESGSKSRDNYEWLRHCREHYSDYVRVTAASPGPGLLIACGAAIVIAVTCILMKWSIISLVPLAAAVIAGWLHMRAVRESATAGVGERAELDRMAAEYVVRFGEALTGAPQLDQQFEKLSREQGRVAELETGVRGLQEECAALRDRIAQAFRQLVDSDVPAELWAGEVLRLKRERDGLEKQRSSAAEELARLNVNDEEMLEDDPGAAFSSGNLERLLLDRDAVRSELARDEQRLADIKEAIARETGSSPFESFESLLHALSERQEQAVDSCRAVAAQIIAWKVVHDVVARFREEEDRNVREGLACDAVTDALRAVTGVYSEISFEDGQLHVSNPTSDYEFATLSTGAQEQVMLAIRMGFAMRISGGDPMFLILDDAFQHSDWRRREQLVDQVVFLVDKGWQVFYLTMDDHLRDLFRARGAALAPGRFVEAVLGGSD